MQYTGMAKENTGINVDNNRPLIYGSTTRIKSEILNGSGWNKQPVSM